MNLLIALVSFVILAMAEAVYIYNTYTKDMEHGGGGGTFAATEVWNECGTTKNDC